MTGLACRQHRVVSRSQLLGLGLGAEAIKNWRTTGRLFGIHRGVYALGPGPLDRRGEWMAATLACGPTSLISHRSAGALWGMTRTRPGTVEVVLPGDRRRHRGIIVHRTRDLAPEDRARHRGIPVASVARTLVDLAGVLDANALRHAVEEADRLGLFRLPAVLSACDRANGRRGIGALRAILADYTVAPDTLSPLEDAFLAFCREHGIALPQTNVTLAGWLVDACWPAAKLVVELDSWEFHADRGQFDRDRRKGLAIQDAGYDFTRLSGPQLEGREGDETAARLRRKLARWT